MHYYIFSAKKENNKIKLGYGPVHYSEEMKENLLSASETFENGALLPNGISLEECFEMYGGDVIKDKMKQIQDVIVKGKCDEHSLHTLEFEDIVIDPYIKDFIKAANKDKKKMKIIDKCFMEG